MNVEGMELSVTEQFVLLKVINNKCGKSSKIKFVDRNISTVISTVIELILKDKIFINENKEVIIKDSNAVGVEYQDEVLKILCSKKPRKIRKCIEYFIIHSNSADKIFDCVVKSIIEKNIISVDANKKTYIDYKNICPAIIKKIRSEFLEEENVNRETMYLATLLESDKSLDIYFANEEYKNIKIRMKEISEKIDDNEVKTIVEIVRGIKISSIMEGIFNVISSI